MNKSRTKKFLHSNLSDFNQTHFSQSQMSFKNNTRRKDCCSGDNGKLKDVKIPLPNQKLEGIKMVRKSKSSSKLTSMTAAKKIYRGQ